MKYKLIGSNDTNNIIATILSNRGVTNPQQYMNLSEDCICDWQELNNIDEAINCFVKHFENKNDITILVDCDPDG